MRKFYSLLIAGVAAFSASAFAASDSSPEFITPLLPRTEKAQQVQEWPAQTALAKTAKTFRGARKADGDTSIDGFWEFYLGDFYDEVNSAFDYIVVKYQAEVSNGVVTFTPDNDLNDNPERFHAFKGEYDEENGTVTLYKELLSIQNGRYLFQAPYEYDAKNYDLIDLESLEGTFDDETGALEFPIDCGLAWALYGDAAGIEFLGNISIFDIFSGYLFNSTSALAGEWEKVGNVTFYDPWLVPALGPDYEEQNGYSVLFEQNVEIPTRFRLVNPYKSGPVAHWNGSEGGYIVFDIADHNRVVFYPTDAGFENTAIIKGGISKFYCYNALGYYMVLYPHLTIREIAQLYDYIPFTKYTDNTVVLGSVTGNGVTAYDANFGTQKNPYGGMAWGAVMTGGMAWEAVMTGSIVFPTWFNAAVGAVAVDDNAEPEYYSISGVRLANPQPGQIVIKKAGSKVTKEIIK